MRPLEHTSARGLRIPDRPRPAVARALAALVLSGLACRRPPTPSRAAPGGDPPVALAPPRADTRVHDAATAPAARGSDAGTPSAARALAAVDAGAAAGRRLFCNAHDGRAPVAQWRAAVPRDAEVAVLSSEDLDGDGRRDALATVHYVCDLGGGETEQHVALLVAWNDAAGWTLEDLWARGESDVAQESGRARVLGLAGERFVFVWGSANGSGGAMELYAYRARPGRALVAVAPELDFEPFFELDVRLERPDVVLVEGLEDRRRDPAERPQRRWRRSTRLAWDAGGQRFVRATATGPAQVARDAAAGGRGAAP